MATRFKLISDEDVAAVRAARKALTRIAKKLRRLNAVHDKTLDDPSEDYTAVALANWRMLDEVEALGVSSIDGDMLSIRLLPSGTEAKAIRL